MSDFQLSLLCLLVTLGLYFANKCSAAIFSALKRSTFRITEKSNYAPCKNYR